MAGSRDIIDRLATSGRMRIAAALVVTALVGGSLGVIMMQGQAGGNALLFSGLDLEEAAEIANRLDTANIVYELEAGGSAIFVDRSQVDDARMMLSEQGLPTRGSVGWEIFDKTEALGTTSFVQNINKVRALEGELGRTIASLEMVKAARVHLNLPERPLFQREAEKPTASVVVALTGGSMAQEKVRAIRNLVATSVPGLSIDNITVVDSEGRMLAAGAESDQALAGGADADERKTALEASYQRKILEIVENIAGQGAARVQVSAEIDFNRITQSAETFDPESRVLRSSSTIEDSSSSSELSPQDETTVANNVPDGQEAPPAREPVSQSQQNRTEETANYEISKSTRTEIIEGGRVQRLSVAVVVDHQRIQDPNGGPATFAPRSEEELARIATLVKSAIGFSEARGDMVTVENLPFARPDVSMEEAIAPGPFDFDKFDIVRAAELAALLVTALALVFFVLRPLVRGLTEKPKDPAGILLAPGGPTPALPGGGAEEDPFTNEIGRVSGRVNASAVRKVTEVVNAHPNESVAVIRDWLNDGKAQAEGAAERGKAA